MLVKSGSDRAGVMRDEVVVAARVCLVAGLGRRNGLWGSVEAAESVDMVSSSLFTIVLIISHLRSLAFRAASDFSFILILSCSCE